MLETLEKVDKNRLKERLRVPFGVFLVLACLTVSAVMDLPPFSKAWEAVSWEKVPGITKRSTLASVLVGKDPAWRPVVVYTYKVNGKTYANDVIAYQPYLGIPGYEANILRTHYIAGTAVEVSYNPKDPGDSCLEPNPRWDYLLIRLTLYFLFAALVYLSCYPPAKADESL